MLIPGLEQRKYKMSLKHVVAPESKEVLKNDEDLSKGPRGHHERAPTGQICATLGTKINNESNELSPLNKIRTISPYYGK